MLAFPCNQFAGQEPGTNEEILEFARSKYGATFPMFAKIDVNGPGRDPLYGWLTAAETGPEAAGDVKWNFGKFLVGRDGRVLARFGPQTEPQSAELTEAIEKALGE